MITVTKETMIFKQTFEIVTDTYFRSVNINQRVESRLVVSIINLQNMEVPETQVIFHHLYLAHDQLDNKKGKLFTGGLFCYLINKCKSVLYEV